MEHSTLLALAHILFYAIVAGLVAMIGWRSLQTASLLGLTGFARQFTTVAPLALVSGWLLLTAVAAWNGLLADFTRIPPRIMIPPVLALLSIIGWSFSRGAKRLRAVAPETWFVEFQTFRVVMEGVLWLLWSAGIIPVQMSFEGRNFDIVVGCTAPIVAYYCFRKRVWSPRVAIVWNIVSVGLLLNIVIISALSSPTFLRTFVNEPANTMIAYFPFIWLPAFVVPVAFAGHIFSLRQLLERAR
jgi:hypothetical protein